MGGGGEAGRLEKGESPRRALRGAAGAQPQGGGWACNVLGPAAGAVRRRRARGTPPAHQLPSSGPCFPPAPRAVSAIQLGTVERASTYMRLCAQCGLRRRPGSFAENDSVSWYSEHGPRCSIAVIHKKLVSIRPIPGSAQSDHHIRPGASGDRKPAHPRQVHDVPISSCFNGLYQYDPFSVLIPIG